MPGPFHSVAHHSHHVAPTSSLGWGTRGSPSMLFRGENTWEAAHGGGFNRPGWSAHSQGHVCVGQSLSNTAGCLQDSGENTTISVTFCFPTALKHPFTNSVNVYRVASLDSSSPSGERPVNTVTTSCDQGTCVKEAGRVPRGAWRSVRTRPRPRCSEEGTLQLLPEDCRALLLVVKQLALSSLCGWSHRESHLCFGVKKEWSRQLTEVGTFYPAIAWIYGVVSQQVTLCMSLVPASHFPMANDPA